MVCYGRGYKDFVLYLAFILNNMGYKVLVDDKSMNKELAEVISHKDFNCPVRTYRNIDFNFSNTELKGYDFVITYCSEIESAESCIGGRYLIINASACKSELYGCEKLINTLKADTMFILRDQVGSIGKKYIGKYMLPADKILGIYEVKFDEYDKEYQYSMDYDGVTNFKYLSEGMTKVLIRCVSVISGREQDVIKKAFKWAKGGKVFDNRFLE